MLIDFHKYHGTGNDFVIVDDRKERFHPTSVQVAALCERRFGIGADGLILVREDGELLRMVYFNSDGRESTMCGNGGRCFVAFCHFIGAMADSGEFLAVDGLHMFRMERSNVSLKMQDVPSLELLGQDVVLDTGSPHFIRFMDVVDGMDVHAEGRAIRNSDRFKRDGINVNFVSSEEGQIRVRTYERGVEGETFSCGTGVTAAALAFDHTRGETSQMITVQTLGGELQVSFKRNGSGYEDVWLHGPAVRVYEGQVEVSG